MTQVHMKMPAERDDNYLNEIIKEKSLRGLVANETWVKLISTLVENFEIIKECRVKLIWEEGEPKRRILFDEFTDYNFDYYDTAMEAMISGEPKGWYVYKEIEWLDFPSGQDQTSIKKLIDELGGFEWELREENLRLYAYLKKG